MIPLPEGEALGVKRQVAPEKWHALADRLETFFVVHTFSGRGQNAASWAKSKPENSGKSGLVFRSCSEPARSERSVKNAQFKLCKADISPTFRRSKVLMLPRLTAKNRPFQRSGEVGKSSGAPIFCTLIFSIVPLCRDANYA